MRVIQLLIMGPYLCLCEFAFSHDVADTSTPKSVGLCQQFVDAHQQRRVEAEFVIASQYSHVYESIGSMAASRTTVSDFSVPTIVEYGRYLIRYCTEHPNEKTALAQPIFMKDYENNPSYYRNFQEPDSISSKWLCGRLGTQFEINKCSSNDLQKLGVRLNYLYKKQITRVQGSPHEGRLRDAQSAWLSYIKADCFYQNGPSEESGSIWPYLQNVCMGEHFKQRIMFLKEFVDCTQEGCIGKYEEYHSQKNKLLN